MGKYGQEPQLLLKPKFLTTQVGNLLEKEKGEKTIPATTLPKTDGAAMETTADLIISRIPRGPILEVKERTKAKAEAEAGAEEATVISRRESRIKRGLRCSLRKIKVRLLKQELRSTYLPEVPTQKILITIPFS